MSQNFVTKRPRFRSEGLVKKEGGLGPVSSVYAVMSEFGLSERLPPAINLLHW
jgi:hypothetical protein